MESGKIFGSDEDSRSCESGWTMYLASPSHDHHEDDDCYYHDVDVDEEDSDGGDSMESDASSGPMEAALKLSQEIEEPNSTKKKKNKKTTSEEMENTRVHNNIYQDNDHDDGDGDGDDDGDNHGYNDGNDSYSAVHDCYVGSVRQFV